MSPPDPQFQLQGEKPLVSADDQFAPPSMVQNNLPASQIQPFAAALPTEKAAAISGVNTPSAGPFTMINIDLIKSWVDFCEQYHGKYCSDLQLSTPLGDEAIIMLIDVANNCRVTATTKARFCALSYVWGTVSQLQTTKATLEDLKTPGAISRQWTKIPHTIQDAIELVRLLGEQYLWVDTLCIVQDDSRMKAQQISQMAFIYCSAILSFVAAAASDASYFLPGIRESTRKSQDWDQRASNSIDFNTPAAPDDSLEEIENSVYGSRAWTWQERILSRRRLYFCNPQLYFECNRAFWCEEPRKPPFDGPDPYEIRVMPGNKLAYASKWASAINDRRWDQAFAFCTTLIDNYSTKNMSHSSDVMNALSGVLSALQSYLYWRFCYGLPEPLLELGLLWTSTRTAERRPSVTTGPSNSFPSWSWVGWIGEVNFDAAFDVPFHHHLPRIVNLEIQDSSHPSGFRPVSVTDWGRPKDPINPHHRITMIRDPITRPSPQSVFNANIGPLLRMHAYTASATPFEFRTATIGRPYRTKVGSQMGIFIYYDSRICGLLYGIDAEKLQTYDISTCLFIQLFVRPTPPEIYFFEDVPAYEEYSNWTYGYSWDALPVLDIMLVEKKGEFCQRVAIGHMDQEAWLAQEPELGAVILG